MVKKTRKTLENLRAVKIDYEISVVDDFPSASSHEIYIYIYIYSL